MALATINEVLFENNDKIPEGLYLTLMNLTKDLFNEKPEPVIKWRNVFKEPIKHRMRGIHHATESWVLKKVDIIEERRHRALRYRGIGDIIECVEFGDKQKFLQIEKINKCSIHFVEYIFWKGQLSHKCDRRRWHLKIGEKHPMGHDCLYDNLLPKGVMFYEMTATESKQRWDECDIRWQSSVEAFIQQSPPPNNDPQSPEYSPNNDPDIPEELLQYYDPDIPNLPVDF